MLLVRIVFLLLLGRAILGRPFFASSGTGSDGDAAAPPEEAVVDAEPEPDQELPDNARRRTPSLIRMSGTLAPVAGFMGFAIAVAGFVAQNTGWQLPIIGEVVGDWPLALLLITIALWAVWLLWQVPRWQAAAWRQSMELKEREIFDIENSSRATLGQILSGVAVLAGLIFAWQQLGNTSQTLYVSQEGQITDRFTRAVDQLGNDDLTIRLGGIYALERIARDSERDHETVMEILAAFARQRSAAETAAMEIASAGSEAGAGTPALAPESGGGMAADTTSLISTRAIPLDLDVVLKVISRRDSSRDGPGCIDLSGINLAGSQLGGTSLDLTNVCLRNADLRSSQLAGVNFAGADLAGSDFTNANLDRANLAGAQLSNTIFVRANLSVADLTGATLTGANLQGATLQGTVLRDAILNGTDLSLSTMIGADFQGANLIGADLTGATMVGVNLQGATNITVEQVEAAALDGTSQLPPGIPATPDF